MFTNATHSVMLSTHYVVNPCITQAWESINPAIKGGAGGGGVLMVSRHTRETAPVLTSDIGGRQF